MLRAEGLSFWYDRGDPPIIYRSNFVVPPAHILAIVGASGSGKSTLLRLAAGLMQAQLRRYGSGRARREGAVYFRSEALREPRPEFSYVPQNCGGSLLPALSARNNVLLAVAANGISPEERRDADDLLAATGIASVGHLRIDKLSGGQRQRVAICRALITRPQIIFLDEPFASLDPGLRPSMGELLIQLRRNGLSVLMVTHDVAETVRIADEVLSIRITYGRPLDRLWRSGDADFNQERIESWMIRGV